MAQVNQPPASMFALNEAPFAVDEPEVSPDAGPEKIKMDQISAETTTSTDGIRCLLSLWSTTEGYIEVVST